MKTPARAERADSHVSDRFREFLQRKGLSLTGVRDLILKEVLRQKKHFQAQDLYAALSKNQQRVSRDAVFRTLPLLLEAGVIQKSVGSGKGDFFEVLHGAASHHDHMVCLRCQRVVEFYSEDLEAIQERVCESYGFQLVFHDHRLFGWCRTCKQK
jgi:Fur family ferric uptake transcriptional regulator